MLLHTSQLSVLPSCSIPVIQAKGTGMRTAWHIVAAACDTCSQHLALFV